MSGREKRAPASPEEEREQLRELTRELHEAAQAARDAAREVRQARKDLAESADDIMLDTNQAIVARLKEWGDEQMKNLAEDMSGIDKKVQQHFAELAGMSSPHELMKVIVGQLTRSTAVVARLHTEKILAEKLGEKLGMQVRTTEKGRIGVATAEDLEEFIAAGGDPGIILDFRG